MNPWIALVLTNFLTTLTAVFGVWLSFRRFGKERWWERKAEAYCRIVESLYLVSAYYSALSVEDITGNQLSEERKKELSENCDTAFRELRKATGMGAYSISDAVADVLSNLDKRPRLSPRDTAWFEIFEADREAYQKALEQIRLLAKRDLRQ